MSLKVINLTIPENKALLPEINSFTPEENYLMLKIGIVLYIHKPEI